MRIARRAGFTLIELIVTMAIVGLLAGILLPSLRAARDSARMTVCLSNQKQLTLGWAMYAIGNADRCMPLEIDAPGQLVYWFGAVSLADSSVDHDKGFIAPHLAGAAGDRSVYECPLQPWGSYRAQPISAGPAARPTSTYGYNGYYLCPAGTPGWRDQIGGQRWKKLSDLERPSDLFVFADTLLAGTPPMNTALLDPPQLFSNGGWSANASPTTSFRHARTRGGPGTSVTGRADGAIRTVAGKAEWLTDSRRGIGSVGSENDPHYVPDWKNWR